MAPAAARHLLCFGREHLRGGADFPAKRGLQDLAVVSGGLERWGEVGGAGLDRLGNCHDEAPVSSQDLLRVDDGQANDLLGAWGEAKDVSLGRLFAFAGLRLADLQVEDVAVGVVVGVVEAQRADADVHGFHRLGSFRLASAVMIRAGCCS